MQPESKRRGDWRASFGPFTLSPVERLLERDGVPVRLGGRAFDLLVALVDSAGKTVGKRDLIAQVWPDVVVEEGSLRFHMVAVRKALGDTEGGSRYIVNTANKGYTFAAIVERRELDSPAHATLPFRAKTIPALPTAMVGREDEAEALIASLLQRRLVSIVGAGGIGKTTVAIAVAHSAAKDFDGDAYFIDLSQVSDYALVRASVASAVGLQNRVDDLAALATHLADRKTLIVLDCCEHVIASATELTEVLVRSCARVHILTTSREPLRAEGEFVFRLQPLAFPPQGEGTTAKAALAYPAVQLFVERAAASGSGFELKDSDAPLASQLCRELEGIALAIELAAGRIEALGLKAITSHFDASVRLMWHGRRTAVPRHQTLGATLDWSYNLLADEERRLMRRLSVFSGTFSLDAAIEVCCFELDKSVAVELVAGLVSKSLVTVDAGGATLRYGMFDTTKSYCWNKLRSAGEDVVVTRRFSSFCSAEAQQYAGKNLSNEDLDAVRLELPNLRAALERHFRDAGPSADAVKLAAAVCPLLMMLSQLSECARWAQAALAHMPQELAGSHVEMYLQGALGQSLMFAAGGNEAETAFHRSIELAEHIGDARSTLLLLNGYVVLQQREGRYTEALSTARKAQMLLSELKDPESQAIVDSLMGVALHLVGHVDEALQHWQRCFAHSSGATSGTRSKLGFDFHIRAMCGLARNLWLSGQYARALQVADETIAKARESGHAVTYCIALIWAGSVYVWARNAERLQGIVDTLEGVARKHSLIPYLSVANVTQGQLLISTGRPADGVELIRTTMDVLHQCRYEMVTSVSMTTMARGLSDMSLHAAALSLCDEVESLIQKGGDFLRMPELQSTRGYCLAAAGRLEASEKSYLAGIDLARSQGVKSGQLRAAVELASLLTRSGRREEARRLLCPLVTDAGDETSLDLSLARDLLA